MIVQPDAWSTWSKILPMLFGSFVAVAMLSLQIRPDAEIVAVFYPPWWSAQHMLLAAASADAAIVRLAPASAIVVVRPDERQGLNKLRASGAIFLLDPQAIAACLRLNDWSSNHAY